MDVGRQIHGGAGGRTMIGTSSAPFLQQHKIVTADALPAIRERFRDKTIVLCHGAFDLVHVGHLIHFEEARALGDVLVVTITADAHIMKKRSVSLSQESRARQLAALEVIDYVAIIDEPSAVTPIEALRPDVYVKGPEYEKLVLDKSANIFREKHLVEAYGGRVHFTTGDTFSSTKLSHFLLAAPEAEQEDPLLRNDRVRFRDLSALGFTLEELKRFIVDTSGLRVCLLGETIIDEWVDVALTNLSIKSRCVAGLETRRSRQIGGAGMIALHLAGFVKEVHCVTNGLTDPIPGNVTVTRLAEPSITKTRFVDQDSGYRLFEFKSPDLRDVSSVGLPDFDDYDLVLLADFGHGLLDARMLNASIARHRRSFVTAMAQTNSTNYGYNLATKYKGADYYSVNRTEAELCLHERHLPLCDVLERTTALLHACALSVTDGEHGVMMKRGDDVFALPTLSTSVVDTIGCGDAYFALSSLAAGLGRPARFVTLAGSIGAAAVAQRRGNENPTSEQEFLTIGKIVI
ncbi:MAG TPA: PfkB family carbohydrate kinase [Vicinamibacterales bacterium]|jgi:cytidyltransferase-like protein|nr:PfkB family carbohydrate kinase [Vicinamibacterales bacterium]